MFITGKASNVLVEKITSKRGEEYKKTSFTVSNEQESIRLETLNACSVGEGDTGTFTFASKVRTWKDKYFNSMEFKTLTPVDGATTSVSANSNEDDSDLPF